jgi:hypothetical protein
VKRLLRTCLVGELTKKAEIAQKAGNLKALDKVEDEIKAFEDRGELPKSVSTMVYTNEMRRIRAKLVDAYAEAVKEYTKAGKRAEARAAQMNLDELKSGVRNVAPKATEKKTLSDLLVEGTILTGDYKWTNANFPPGTIVITVSERDGKNFKGTHVAKDKNNPNAASDIAGELVGNVITYKRINSEAKFGFSVKGELKGNRLECKFIGENGLKIDMTLAVPK